MLLRSSHAPRQFGFTLIELSIVLVIIGLIIGGILTGKELIESAAQTAQIAQMEKYKTAVRTFQNKYGGLPGDLPDPTATNFGFQSRGAFAGEGDGNGVIDGNCTNTAGANSGLSVGCGELAVFWQDLSTAGLIDTNIPTTLANGYPHAAGQSNGTVSLTSFPHAVSNWLPTAKIGQGNFIYVYAYKSINYFCLQLVSKIGLNVESTGVASAGNNALTVQQAYNIDKKIDDGLPQSGSVNTCDADYDVGAGTYVWAAGGNHVGTGANCAPSTAATTYHNYNCFDNNGVAGTQTYSVGQNANVQNCALSFRFQ